jgi:hypothetical protein
MNKINRIENDPNLTLNMDYRIKSVTPASGVKADSAAAQ